MSAAAVLLLAFSAVALVFRAQPVSSIPRLVLSVAATFVPLIAVTGLALALAGRRVVLAVIGAFLVTATVAIQVTWYYFGRPADVGRYTEIRVLSSNLRYGLADPSQFVDLAKSGADVIAVAELTAEAVDRFKQHGIDQTFPYAELKPGPGPGGIGLWSRYPIAPLSVARHRNVKLRRLE